MREGGLQSILAAILLHLLEAGVVRPFFTFPSSPCLCSRSSLIFFRTIFPCDIGCCLQSYCPHHYHSRDDTLSESLTCLSLSLSLYPPHPHVCAMFPFHIFPPPLDLDHCEKVDRIKKRHCSIREAFSIFASPPGPCLALMPCVMHTYCRVRYYTTTCRKEGRKGHPSPAEEGKFFFFSFLFLLFFLFSFFFSFYNFLFSIHGGVSL